MNLEKFQDYFDDFMEEYFEYLSVYPTIYYGYDKTFGWACFAENEFGEKRMDVPLKDELSNPFNKVFYKLGNKKLYFELGAYIQKIFKLNFAELTSPDENLVVVKRKKNYLENLDSEDLLMSLTEFPKQIYDVDESKLKELDDYFFLTSNYVYEYERNSMLYRELKETLTSFDNRFILNISYAVPLNSTIVQKINNAFLIRIY